MEVLILGQHLLRTASGDAKILLSGCNLKKIILNFRTAYQDRQAGERVAKCLFQVNNRIARVGFEPRPCPSQSRRSNHSTMPPTKTIEKYNFIYLVDSD